MNRRLTQLLILCAVMLFPVIALADDGGAGTYGDLIQKHGKLVAVLASFGFGFLASLTPCVYPMVPITVSIFGATEAKSRWRGAALSGTFVLGIASLFTPMGIVSAMSGKLMGSALSNSFVVVGLALLFAALAASMFGAFELALPSSLNNKLSSVGGVGYKGAFVMGLVMGLIAAPCTGPFLTGMITVIATSKSVVLGGASLFSFALGLGVLFFVAGAFAVGLPKGGAWMMGIKWVSGVGLAYMSFAYLRDRFEPFRSLIAHPGYAFGIATGALFLVGIILGLVHMVAERRKSPIAHLSKPMKLASILPAVIGCAAFISWLPQPHGVSGDAPTIAWVTSEEAGRAKAISENKPVLIDFGAEWCAGCKELEHETFPDATVRTEAQRFVAIRVDATDDEAPDTKRLSEKYKVIGLPTVIMLDANGKEIARFNQFVKPDKFVEAMKKVPAASNAVGMK
ncbi:MAG: Cytochrome c-type biosis protein DsbD, protein-disulfide reductase [Labilithrix sp.]|nr:Cytochrome c-type biosis protein DsbD, protein-disulfide reductase [Labilithrix sp.]